MTTPDTLTAVPAAKKQLTIKVLGIGGCGGNIVAQMHRDGFTGAQLISLNTDAQALAQCPLPYKFNLGLRLNGGLGAGGDPERGKAAAEEDEARLRDLCTGVDMVFICAGLGGGTGTGAGPVAGRIAKECGALTLAFVTLPFDCEGPKRMQQARLGLDEFKSAVDGVICLPNQKVFKLIDENTSVIETFAATNELLAQGVRGIGQLVTRPGFINLDFADLCSVVRNRHSESTFAHAQASGPQRATEVVEKLLANPLLDDGTVLNEADAVVVSIMSGPSLTMAEVNRVMAPVNRHCETAQITMGTAIEESLGDRLTITLVASRRPKQPAEPPRATTVEAEPSPTPREGTDFDLLGAAIITKPVSRSAPVATPEPARTSAPVAITAATEAAPTLVVPPPPAAVSGSWRSRKKTKVSHPELQLEVVAKGPFESSEPTLRNGVNLDVPTFVRRGLVMN